MATMIQPDANPEDAKAVARHLRMLSDAELSQAIASPLVLVGSLPGFNLDHLRTAAEEAVVQLALDEQTRRRSAEVLQQARLSRRVALGALVVGVLALIVSILGWLFPRRWRDGADATTCPRLAAQRWFQIRPDDRPR
jgi:hypothetical protein